MSYIIAFKKEDKEVYFCGYNHESTQDKVRLTGHLADARRFKTKEDAVAKGLELLINFPGASNENFSIAARELRS